MDVDDEDYEYLLDRNFNPISFANDLLLATNSQISKELDLSTSIKRLNFDINNISLQIDKISEEQYEKIIDEIKQDQIIKDEFQKLNKPLQNINMSYQRLDKDILKPYKEALDIQDALKKIHTTSYLLRGVIHFLYLIQQIEGIEINEKLSPMILLKLSNLESQLKSHLNGNSNLKSLKIIRDYELITDKKIIKLSEIILTKLKNINEKTLANYTNSEIASYYKALYNLNAQRVYEYINMFISNSAIVSVNTLTRVLNSPRNIENALEEVSKRGLFINIISQILSEIFIENETTTLLNKVLESLEYSNMISIFWRDVAKKFENNFKQTIMRGGPVAKSLFNYKDQIKASVKKAVIGTSKDNNNYNNNNNNNIGYSVVDEDGIEVRMMLNSVGALDKKLKDGN